MSAISVENLEVSVFWEQLPQNPDKESVEDVLKATSYQRTEGRTGYANGFKERHIQSRVGELALQISQTRNVEFYPSCLERGLRSERAINLAMAEMYIQGVATRSVRNILEKRCGLEVNTIQVCRTTKNLKNMQVRLQNLLNGLKERARKD